MLATERVAFGKYTLIAKLAAGGMGEIFLARAPGLEEVVVIKRLLPHLAVDSHFVTMLLDEARIAARLSHPNICRVHDLGEVDGNPYIAMEHLEGVPVSKVLARESRHGGLDSRLAAGLLVQACDGLHHAHELVDDGGAPLGLVHRDVSPSNLFLASSGALKVLDFGVAKSADALARTHTGVMKGKFPYMSPEQVLGDPVDRRSDVFSLGTVFWELLAGQRLFWRDSEYRIFQAILVDDMPPLREGRNVPASVAAVVAKALARDPTERYASAQELRDAIVAGLAAHGGVASTDELGKYVRLGFSRETELHRELVHAAAPRDDASFDLSTVAEGSRHTARPSLGAEPLGSRLEQEGGLDLESAEIVYERQAPNGSVRFFRPSRTVVISVVDGHLADCHTDAVMAMLDRVIAEARPVALFYDWHRMTGYDSRVRTEWTRYTMQHRAEIEVLHILVRSRLVAMGVSTAAMALAFRGQELHSYPYTLRVSFDMRLRERIDADRRVRQNDLG